MREEDESGEYEYTYARRNRIYRSRDGWFLGVAAGIAEHFDFSVWATRLVFVLIGFTIGMPWFPIMYIIAGMMMKKAPERHFRDEHEEDFWNTYQSSRSDALRRVHNAFETLDRRMQRMESTVTSRNFDLEDEYRKL